MQKVTVSVLAALLFLNCLLGLTFAKRGTSTVTPADILRIRKLDGVALAPDGRRVLFTVYDPDSNAFGSTPVSPKVWVATTDDTGEAHPVAMDLNRSGSPAWAPDGHSFAFLSRDSRGNAQVFLLPDGSTEAQQLTSAPGGVNQFAWSPDGTTIAFASSVQQTREASASVVTDFAQSIDQLSLYDLKTHEITQVRKQIGGIQNFAWSPSGREFALIVSSPNPNDYGAGVLLVVDRKHGTIARTLSRNVGESGSLAWAPDGRTISFIECVPRNVTAWWLAIAPAAGGKTRPILKDSMLSVLGVEWEADSRHLVGELVEGTRIALASIDTKTNSFTTLQTILSSQGDYAFSASAGGIAFAQQTTTSPNDVWVRRPDGSSRRLTNLNPQTSSWRLGTVREVSWRNKHDHLLLHGLLITPPGYQPGQTYATIIQCHLGDDPWTYGWIADFWQWGQLLASRGYVVFLPNTRGVSGQGWRLHETLNNWGGMAYQDLVDGIDDLVKRGIADPTQLGIAGWSNGGFMSAYAIAHTTRFKAAVVEDGHVDFFTLFGTADWRSLILQLGTNPYFDRRPYDKASPITTVRNVKTPTLLLWGADDQVVPITQGYELHTALKILGVETRMISYPNEGHEIDQPIHRLDLQNRVLEWFDAHLKRRV